MGATDVSRECAIYNMIDFSRYRLSTLYTAPDIVKVKVTQLCPILWDPMN